MYPILGRYGPFFLFSYTAVMSLGIVIGIGFTVWQARRRGLSADWLDGLLAALAAGVMGGRAGFVWGEWAYFQERPSAILQIQQGGLNYHGALLAGLMALWGWCWWQKRPFLPTAALLAPGIALASAFGWFACWLDGCAYGQEAAAGSLLAADLPDKFGIYGWRYQTQILGIALSLLVFVWVWPRQRRWLPGQTFGFTLFALSLSRIGIELLRSDSVLQLSGININIILDTAFALFSLLLLKYTSRRKPAKT